MHSRGRLQDNIYSLGSVLNTSQTLAKHYFKRSDYKKAKEALEEEAAAAGLSAGELARLKQQHSVTRQHSVAGLVQVRHVAGAVAGRGDPRQAGDGIGVPDEHEFQFVRIPVHDADVAVPASGGIHAPRR